MTLDDMLLSAPKGRIVLVQADHESSLLTMEGARCEGLADFILIGNRDRIDEKAAKLAISLKGIDIRSAGSDVEASNMAAQMAADGEADIVMKGLVHTSVFTKALLNRERKLISPGGLISHAALFELPGQQHPFILSDAAVNIEPNLNEKASILNNALSLSRLLGIKVPKAVCVAPVETVNPKIQSTIDADALSSMDFTDALVEGPLALDAALSRDAARIKGIESLAAGDADVLLFPDLNSANGVYKALSLHPGCRYGGILTGLKIPVILTSRSDSEEVRLLSLKMALAVSGA